MSWLWTTETMVSVMEGRPVGTPPEGITGISIDSRSISPGEAFFAIKGDRVDGHDFASIAVANGASLIIVSEAKLPAMGRLTVPMIVVDDVLAALGRLAAAARQRSRAKIVAVTGSVGKTTTKEMLRHVLAPSGRVHAAVASFNNHWGVPLTLARMPADTEFGVFEIGMNHAGEIRPLVKLVRPHVAIITTIAAAHLGHFKGIEEIAAAKAEIFEGLEPGGAVILNRDNKQFDYLEKRAQETGVERIYSFGQHAKADFRLADFEGDSRSSTIWATLNGETVEVHIGSPGRHIAENAMAALGACLLVEADLSKAISALPDLRPVKGRGEQHRLGIGEGTLTLIDESYNANPASVRAAIALLAASEPQVSGRRIAVLGDMLEMGEFSSKVHEELAGPILAAGIEHVWLAGPEMAALRDALPDSVHVEYHPDTESLVSYAVSAVTPGDVVMVKSSLGLGFGKIVAALIDNYPAVSDRERQL
ncbi:MAG: UDP-N-acetylmuramoylalanyl-D-glutamyl-2,6-diaminopimelate--D-alanyl-D-alanine ligase [Alphaproteobacteria bacterium]|nr:UDP-N-acetylmuramoylalanyl-D-glutamyl-2,6-diaminopimelate--D-alanyl-D-alanine ligase [Alphaproteobacteria bacterium]MBU1550543.1 UDP-N-acetylmuramoylalanyl-D-glutamyl-2,6-diaminopimelate--D-alanyl-D-alanine ligase [Alphaproteobacteria bacterium]MBU2338679.1 UDP-N-acetylmuramoylalanyl-D-glutamyl-2,6-diaminopimelate--D-alanyl-D-alanine ligase [Alphaproteobacteria bacterium]MBU2386770.1 UDP-N-acetylmuramoylalanyl-D-glutamyl-2,6-diaminopimelate--D-alanyl-D-alanine ligase [Alphaproteobacteria bact